MRGSSRGARRSRGLRARAPPAKLKRPGLALLVSSPYYVRNLAEFGTPFRMSRLDPLVLNVERAQPPGVRRLDDFAYVSPRLFTAPVPRGPHMLHSVWGTVYANWWSDASYASTITGPGTHEREVLGLGQNHSTSTLLLLLGLVPTALAAWGSWLSLRAALRDSSAAADAAGVLLAAATLGTFAFSAWHVPIWSGLKASYLMSLSVTPRDPRARCYST